MKIRWSVPAAEDLERSGAGSGKTQASGEFDSRVAGEVGLRGGAAFRTGQVNSHYTGSVPDSLPFWAVPAVLLFDR